MKTTEQKQQILDLVKKLSAILPDANYELSEDLQKLRDCKTIEEFKATVHSLVGRNPVWEKLQNEVLLDEKQIEDYLSLVCRMVIEDPIPVSSTHFSTNHLKLVFYNLILKVRGYYEDVLVGG